MATFLFWNLQQKELTTDLVTLCHQHSVDVLILAESSLDEGHLLTALNHQRRRTKFVAPYQPSKYLRFFYKYPSTAINNIADVGRVSIKRLQPPVGIEILLVALHLPSKRFMTEDDQLCHAIEVMQVIQKFEQQLGHTQTLVIGDFNMNPFEKGLVSATGFHAIMDRQIARQQSRKVQGKPYPFFYNPFWGRLGDTSLGPAGTHYYNASSYLNYFWHTFDQILLRPALLNYFSPDQPLVLSKVGPRSLLDRQGKIKSSASDHLPVMITLNLERGN